MYCIQRAMKTVANDTMHNRFGWRCVRDRGTLCQPQSHHPTISLAQRRGLRGGGFVDAVPKARPEYSEGHAQKIIEQRLKTKE